MFNSNNSTEAHSQKGYYYNQGTTNVPVFFIHKLAKLINQPDTKITSLQKLNSFKIEAIDGQGKLNLKLDFEKTSYRGDDPTIILTLHQGLIGSNPYSQQHTFKQSINQGSYDQAQSLLNLIKEKLNLNQTDKQTEKDSRKTQSRNHFYEENKKDRDILRYLSRKVAELKEQVNYLYRDNHRLREELNSKPQHSFVNDQAWNFGQIMKDAAQDKILPFLNLVPRLEAYKEHLKVKLKITDKHYQGRALLNEQQKEGIVKAPRDLFNLPSHLNDIDTKKLIKDSLRQFRSQMLRISDDPHTRELIQKINPQILDRAVKIFQELNGIYDFSKDLL